MRRIIFVAGFVILFLFPSASYGQSDNPTLEQLEAAANGNMTSTAFDGNISRTASAKEPLTVGVSAAADSGKEAVTTLTAGESPKNVIAGHVPPPVEEKPKAREHAADTEQKNGKTPLLAVIGAFLLAGLMAAGRLVHKLRKKNFEEDDKATSVIGVKG